MDLMLDGDGILLGLEIKTLRRSDLTIEVDRWLADLTLRLLIAMADGEVLITGQAREAVDDEETEVLAERIIDAARLVRAGLEAPPIWGRTNHFAVRRPRPDEQAGSRIAMPAEDLWRRTTARKASAAGQMTKSGARWLVIESLDNMWEITPWSREPAAARASSLAEAARGLLATQAHVDGMVFTDGAAIIDPGSPDEDSTPEPTVVYIRRRLDYVRSRQAIVVAVTGDGLQALPAWRSLFDCESGLAEWALTRLGLPTPAQLAAVRSV